MKPSEAEQISRPEFRQLPETRWVQNLRHSSYQLCQPIPVLVERASDGVSVSYEDVELYGTGESVKAAILDLCAKIVAHYEELKANGVKSQDYTFLKQIIEEIQPPAWEEVKQLYQEKLEALPYVQRGYIKIDGNEADVFIILSEESVDKIKHLAGIDLEINLKSRQLYFFFAPLRPIYPPCSAWIAKSKPLYLFSSPYLLCVLASLRSI